jgi:hypothetical protein
MSPNNTKQSKIEQSKAQRKTYTLIIGTSKRINPEGTEVDELKSE